MKLSEEKKTHGFCLHQIIQSASKLDNLSFRIEDCITRSAYALRLVSPKIDKTIGVFIKQCQHRRPPWRYTLFNDHQAEIDMMLEEYDEVFVLLVINQVDDGGVICLNYRDLKQVLDDNHEPTEWIAVDKDLGTQYKVWGKDGKLNRKVSRQDFPRLIVNSIEKMIQVNPKGKPWSVISNLFRSKP